MSVTSSDGEMCPPRCWDWTRAGARPTVVPDRDLPPQCCLGASAWEREAALPTLSLSSSHASERGQLSSNKFAMAKHPWCDLLTSREQQSQRRLSVEVQARVCRLNTQCCAPSVCPARLLWSSSGNVELPSHRSPPLKNTKPMPKHCHCSSVGD